LSDGNWKSLAIDDGQSNWRYNQPIGSGRTQRPSTKDISSRGNRPQVPWCVTMENYLCQHGDLKLTYLRCHSNVYIVYYYYYYYYLITFITIHLLDPGRLSWLGRLTHSGRSTHKVVTGQP